MSTKITEYLDDFLLAITGLIVGFAVVPIVADSFIFCMWLVKAVLKFLGVLQ